ncbi:MAG: hypothetical protein MN733_05990 [Nitrososphaera sp.]|nr:hypothetical protein [Nitrososphaera sp.]
MKLISKRRNEMKANINYKVLDIYLARGLCDGEGEPEGQVCVEEAVCLAMGLPISDDPPCTAKSLSSYSIALNDSQWSSPKARAEGLRALAYAQIGTAGKLNEEIFSSRLGELTIRVLIPTLFRELGICKEEADLCEREGTPGACRDAVEAARDSSRAEKVAALAEKAARAATAAEAASRAAQAKQAETRAEKAAQAAWESEKAAQVAKATAETVAMAHTDRDKFFKLSASLCLLALKEQGFVGDRG